jgi:hypothetical protein
MKSLTLEQAILEKVRLLPPEQQQTVLDFAEFLTHKGQPIRATSPEVDSEGTAVPQPSSPEPTAYVPKTPLGKRLRELRAQIVASGERLLTAEEIEQEIAEQRDRLRYLEQ